MDAAALRAIQAPPKERRKPVGFRAVRLGFEIDADATAEQVATLLKLTERYCVVLQTLNLKPALDVRMALAGRPPGC